MMQRSKSSDCRGNHPFGWRRVAVCASRGWSLCVVFEGPLRAPLKMTPAERLGIAFCAVNETLGVGEFATPSAVSPCLRCALRDVNYVSRDEVRPALRAAGPMLCRRVRTLPPNRECPAQPGAPAHGAPFAAARQPSAVTAGRRSRRRQGPLIQAESRAPPPPPRRCTAPPGCPGSPDACASPAARPRRRRTRRPCGSSPRCR